MSDVSPPTVISLYTGAGGLDYGFEAAGFETAVAVEMDPEACDTLRRNRSWPVVERDIHAVPTAEILRTAGLARGEADVVIGGPPCQPFSKSGYWARGDARRLDDPRAGTLDAFLRVVEESRPRALLLENVPGLAFAGKDEGLARILAGIAEINRRVGTAYRPFHFVLNAKDFGVPQDRSRFFLVAAREGAPFELPTPTHGDPEAPGGPGGVEPWRTAWDALGDLPAAGEEPERGELAMRGKWAGLLPSIPEGRNYLWHTDRGGGLPLFGWRRRYWSFLLKLEKARPSWTLQAQPGPAVGPFHWTSRRLSRRELCRLQTFPDDVHVPGTRVAAQRQIGNAVPSLLAEVLGRAIRAQWLGRTIPAGAPKLLPPVRVPVPPPERRRPVPRRYRPLAGRHAAHPGTGRGYGALARSERGE